MPVPDAVNVLSQADATVVQKAHVLVDELPSLVRCADVDALASAVPPPDPDSGPAVEAIRERLAGVDLA